MRREAATLVVVCALSSGCAGALAPMPETTAQGVFAVHADGDHDDHDHDHDHGDEANARTLEHGEHHEHAHGEHEHHHAHIVLTPEVRRAAARVVLLQSTRTERMTEVVGVVDVHEDSGDQDEALAELRAQAMLLGADAVLGVEFHHGETHGEPTHLSGLAVRFLTALPATGY